MMYNKENKRAMRLSNSDKTQSKNSAGSYIDINQVKNFVL